LSSPLSDLLIANFQYPKFEVAIAGVSPFELPVFGCLTAPERKAIEDASRQLETYNAILVQEAEAIASKGEWSYEEAITYLSYMALGRGFAGIAERLLAKMGWTVQPPEDGDGQIILEGWEKFQRENSVETERFMARAKAAESSDYEQDIIYALAIVRFRMGRLNASKDDLIAIEQERPGLVATLANFARDEEAGVAHGD